MVYNRLSVIGNLSGNGSRCSLLNELVNKNNDGDDFYTIILCSFQNYRINVLSYQLLEDIVECILETITNAIVKTISKAIARK